MSFSLFPECIDQTDLEEARSHFSEDGQHVRYHPMLRFIHETMIPTLVRSLTCPAFIYSKLRISDNNNNTDAAVFHRDLISYRKGETSIPIYTCLCYLDDGQMELIEDSDSINSTRAFLHYWGKKQLLTIRAGSILVIPSKILHRGVFSPNHQGHRRLIQLFDCFLNQDDYDAYFHRILFIPAEIASDGDLTRRITLVASSMRVFWIINYISFQNALSGYNPQRTRKWLDQNGYPEYEYISTDSRQPRMVLAEDENEYQKTNLYWYPSIHHDLLRDAPALRTIQYTIPILYYALWKVMILCIVVTILMLCIRKRLHD